MHYPTWKHAAGAPENSLISLYRQLLELRRQVTRLEETSAALVGERRWMVARLADLAVAREGGAR